MKAKFLKIAGLALALVAFGAVYIVGIHAQQAANKSGAPLVTTNWVGDLVVGQNQTLDQIARGPFPTVVPQVEIGLRSDGVVVWRSVSKAR